MDELALLRDFRLEDAAANGAREHVRAALQRAMTRRRLPQRRLAIALAFVLTALLAAAAYAIVHEFVIGSAAPKDVQDQVGLHLAIGSAGDLIPPRGESRKPVGPALIAAGAQTSIGPVYMLLSRLQGGGECQFVWYTDAPSPKGVPITSGTCEFGKRRHRRFGYAFEGGTAPDGHSYKLVEGYVPGAVRMQIGSRFYKTPFGWFIAEYHRQPTLTAWGVHGGLVARVKLNATGPRTTTTQPPSRSTAPVVPTKPPHVVISTHTAWAQSNIHVTPAGKSFKWRLTHERVQVSIAPDNRGGHCIYVVVRVPGTAPDHNGPGCGFLLNQGQLQAMTYTFGWIAKLDRGPQSVSALALLGQAGAKIARVEVRFSDGRSAPIPLHEGVIFYLVPRKNFAAGHRPVELVGRDASGQVIARKRLPFAR